MRIRSITMAGIVTIVAGSVMVLIACTPTSTLQIDQSSTMESSTTQKPQCPRTKWKYMGSSVPSGKDSSMESSGRRNCRKRLKDSCLTAMIKWDEETYYASCG